VDRKVIAKFILIDFIIMVLLVLIAHICSITKGTLVSPSPDADFMTWLMLRTLTVDNLSIYLVPILSVFFAWMVFRFCRIQEKMMKASALNALAFCVCGLVMYGAVYAVTNGTNYMPQDAFSFLPCILSVSFLQIVIGMLFYGSLRGR